MPSGAARPPETPDRGPQRPLDFETIANPLGPPASVRAALANLAPSASSDPQWRALREMLAARLGVAADQVWAGERLLPEIVQALVAPSGRRALLFTPCPPRYLDAVLAAGAQAIDLHAREEDGWSWDIRGVGGLLRGLGLSSAYLGNPNDPTGIYLGADEVGRLARLLAPASLVIDEGYLPFVEGPTETVPLLREHANLLLLRSLTTAYGLGSLAVEYVVGNPSLVRRVRSAAPPPSPLAAAAQAAGLAALRDPGHVERGTAMARRGAEALRAGCERLGLGVAPSRTSYLLVRTGDATRTTQALAAAGYRVLDCTPLGLPSHIRIAPRRVADCQALVRALAAVLEERGGQ